MTLWPGFAAHAATTDIANAPMASASSTVVKPNIMFILDDSGSMDDRFTPDDAGNFKRSSNEEYGARTSQCNGLYYNPLITYRPPVDAAGASYPDATFTAAWVNGFKTDDGTIDLTDIYYYSYTGAQPKLGFTYDTGGNLITTSTFYEECDSEIGNTPGRNVFTKVIINAGSSAAVKTNVANWYSYYRTRMLTMKTAAGKAFKDIGSNYRIGYSTISYTGTDSANANFLKIADFTATQKSTFYEKLYSASPSGYTPLRGALSKAGRIYAGQLLTGSDDPIQYSCQQNFTILSTDGYWNTHDETSSYGPKKIDGVTDVGNQDLTELRPRFDGSAVVATTSTPTTTVEQRQSVATRTTKTPYSRKQYRLGAYGADGCGGGRRRLFTQPQTYTRTMVQTTTSVDDVTTTATRTVVTTNGTVTSDTTTTGTPTNSNVSSSATTDSDTGAPSGSTTWANGGPETSGNCSNSVSLPNPNPSNPVAGSAAVTTSTPVITVLSSSSTTGTPTTTTVASEFANTLADVASYYYKTDLRTSSCTGALGNSINVCTNNVPGSGADIQPQQHMTTFTLGLGVNGTLRYTENYESASSGDFYDIKQGTKNWPNPIANAGAERIDDLWHAAVNGAGTYFSAQNPDSLVSGISKALAGVSARTGAAAAAATSNLEPVAGDNFVYVALYRTVNWDGDLQAKTIDPATGELSATPDWTAQSRLDTKVTATTDTRTIYKFDSGVNGKLESFEWGNLTADEKAYFNGMCSPTSKLSQCPDLSGTELTAVANGENLVNFLRGQYQYESRAANTDKPYRQRAHVLGDMINSQPVYVKQPPFAYGDDNYTAFKAKRSTAGAARVYVAVNDGMLHAFNGADAANGGGVEEWAYIPPMVMPNLYRLADKNYSANHRYYVDGSPTVGDVCPDAPSSTCTANQWKTILVGGLNAGGRGYYALDITDPDNPKALWNYTVDNDEDLGYSFGNPIITKREDGTWVVVFTSGYNNVAPGDGRGHLFVLNAYTGTRLEKISTSAGDTTTPSGLAKINAWVDSAADNTALRFYGGDLLGNVWRFDIDDRYEPSGKEAVLIAEVGNVGAVGIQPITIKPELTEIRIGNMPYPVINIATGRYLGTSDISDTSQQSIYAFKDNLTATGLGKVRTSGVLVNQALVPLSGGTTRTTTNNDVTWATDSGWYIDLNPSNDSPGERVNVDMQQQLGLITIAANVPENNACTAGGYAWLYSFDYKTGQFVQTAANGIAGKRLLQNSLVAGLKTIKLTTGKTVTLVTDTGGGITPNDDPSSNPGTGSGAKRVSWRELFD